MIQNVHFVHIYNSYLKRIFDTVMFNQTHLKPLQVPYWCRISSVHFPYGSPFLYPLSELRH
jgi:hypothetical protein